MIAVLSSRRELHLALALMVVIWGANYTIAKVALTELPPLPLAAARVTLATVVLFAVLGARGGIRMRRTALPRMAFLGLTGVALNQFLFVRGLDHTVPSHSSLVVALGPIFVLILASLFLDEPIGFKKVTGILLSFAGVMALSLHADFTLDRSHLEGDLTTAGAVLSFAIYTIAGKGAVSEFGALRTTAYSHLFGALFLVPAASLVSPAPPTSVSSRGLLALLYMAVFASALAYLIFYRGLRDLGAARVAALSYFQPLLAIAISVGAAQEALTARILYGGALVLAGVIVAERG